MQLQRIQWRGIRRIREGLDIGEGCIPQLGSVRSWSGRTGGWNGARTAPNPTRPQTFSRLLELKNAPKHLDVKMLRVLDV